MLSTDRLLAQQSVDHAALSMVVHTVLSDEADSNIAVLQNHETITLWLYWQKTVVIVNCVIGRLRVTCTYT